VKPPVLKPREVIALLERLGLQEVRELRAAGYRASRRRVERLMRAAGLRARVARVYHANPRLHRFFDQHPNRPPRHGARRRDRVWWPISPMCPWGAAGTSWRRWRTSTRAVW
jgi:hypothetical protein